MNDPHPKHEFVNSARRVLVYSGLDELAGSVAAQFSSRIQTLLNAQYEATVVLTGGRVGIAILAAIADLPPDQQVDWSRVNVWWGDERWLPRGHADRNDHQAALALLDRVDIPEERIHRFPASNEIDDLDAAAESYANELKDSAPPGSSMPQFDILFLGVGPDGHVASLFPDRPEIKVEDASVVPVRNSPKPPPERLSLTLPTINSANAIWVALTGADKASALGLALASANRNEVPVAGAYGTEETIFFVDRTAITDVPANLITPQ